MDRNEVAEYICLTLCRSHFPSPSCFPLSLASCPRLIYTSASDVSTLGANPVASLGVIYQDARELPVIVNVIDLTPRVLQNLPPGDAASALATATRLKVKVR